MVRAHTLTADHDDRASATRLSVVGWLGNQSEIVAALSESVTPPVFVGRQVSGPEARPSRCRLGRLQGLACCIEYLFASLVRAQSLVTTTEVQRVGNAGVRLLH